MIKVVVVRPWLDGQKTGDVVTLSKLHPSLVSHVRVLNDEPEQEEKQEQEQEKEEKGEENPQPAATGQAKKDKK